MKAKVLAPISSADRRRYAGMWIAVKGSRVVAAARTEANLLRRIAAQRIANALVVRVPTKKDPRVWIF